jgi:uncharacterized protein YcbX
MSNEGAPVPPTPLRLSGIHRYPVKSLRGHDLGSVTVEPWGLAGDRRWMLVDPAGDTVTAREHPQLVLVRPEPTARGLRITRPGAAPLEVDRPDGTELVEVTVWKGPFAAALADDAAHAWFSEVIGRPVRLVYQDDPTRRRPNPEFSRATDHVALADAYPILVTTELSLAAVNELIAAGPLSAEGPLPMARFRPNLVVDGSPAWAEDGWRRVRIGAAEFRAVKGCDRCVLTTIDPETAAKGKEPIATLARHRKWDGKTWFGMQLIPDTPGVRITVGDAVEILEAVDSDGPPR